MTELFLGVGAGCVVQILEIDLDPTPTGWTESMHLEIAAVPDGPTVGSPCPSIALPMPPGAAFDRVRGRVHRADGTRYRVGEERIVLSPPAVDRSRTATVHVPELTTGDRVVLDLDRSLRPGRLQYTGASASNMRFATDAAIDAPASLTRDDDRGSVWGRDVVDATVVVGSADGSPPPTDPLRPAPADTTIEGRLAIEVPKGRDPLVALYPGGGARTVTRLFLEFPPSDVPVGWIVPSGEAEPELAGLSQRFVELTRAGGISRIEIPPSEGPVQLAVSWTTDDAPTYGAVPEGFGVGSPGRIAGWEVDAGRGTIAWTADRRAWALVGIDGRPVVPDRERFVRALTNRFVDLSPEPGLPNALRGLQPSPGLAAALPSALASGVVEWPHDPHWPRKIRKARRSGAMTPTEAALGVWMMARQAGFEANWAFVRPARGPDDTVDFVSPALYDRPVVVFWNLGDAEETDGPWFLDPSCAACGPFELPRELWGSDVLSPDLVRTPPPPSGDVTIVVDGDEGHGVTYRFREAAALGIRQQLGRADELARFLGGAGATATQEGFEDLGQPLEVRVTAASDPYDPLRIVATGPSTAVVPGTRRLECPAHDLPDVDVTSGPLRFRRASRGDRTVEQLTIARGWVAAADIAAIERARFLGYE